MDLQTQNLIREVGIDPGLLERDDITFFENLVGAKRGIDIMKATLNVSQKVGSVLFGKQRYEGKFGENSDGEFLERSEAGRLLKVVRGLREKLIRDPTFIIPKSVREKLIMDLQKLPNAQRLVEELSMVRFPEVHEVDYLRKVFGNIERLQVNQLPKFIGEVQENLQRNRWGSEKFGRDLARLKSRAVTNESRLLTKQIGIFETWGEGTNVFSLLNDLNHFLVDLEHNYKDEKLKVKIENQDVLALRNLWWELNDLLDQYIRIKNDTSRWDYYLGNFKNNFEILQKRIRLFCGEDIANWLGQFSFKNIGEDRDKHMRMLFSREYSDTLKETVTSILRPTNEYLTKNNRMLLMKYIESFQKRRPECLVDFLIRPQNIARLILNAKNHLITTLRERLHELQEEAMHLKSDLKSAIIDRLRGFKKDTYRDIKGFIKVLNGTRRDVEKKLKKAREDFGKIEEPLVLNYASHETSLGMLVKEVLMSRTSQMKIVGKDVIPFMEKMGSLRPIVEEGSTVLDKEGRLSEGDFNVLRRGIAAMEVALRGMARTHKPIKEATKLHEKEKGRLMKTISALRKRLDSDMDLVRKLQEIMNRIKIGLALAVDVDIRKAMSEVLREEKIGMEERIAA